MRSILLIVLSVLSFIPTALSARGFSDRIGFILPGREEITPSTYTLQINTYPVQVELHLDSHNITAKGDNFFAVIFGTQTRLLSPGDQNVLHYGEKIAVIGLLVERVPAESIWPIVSHASNLESLISSFYQDQDKVFVFGVNIEYSPLADIPLLPADFQMLPANPQPRGRKRSYDESSLPAPKRHRRGDYSLQGFNSNVLDFNDTWIMDGKLMEIGSPKVSSNPKVLVQIDNGHMSFICQGGAQIFVFRDGKVLGESSILAKRFPEMVSSKMTVVSEGFYAPDIRFIEAKHGDAVVAFLPADDKVHLGRLMAVNYYLNDSLDPLNNYFRLLYEFEQEAILAFVTISDRES
jgi:hypothetical protein